MFALADQLHKFFIVSNDNQLEIALLTPRLNNATIHQMFFNLKSNLISTWKQFQTISSIHKYPEPKMNSERIQHEFSTWIFNLKYYWTRALAKLSTLCRSKLVVGSSRAKIPQFRQKVSARANRITNEANTFCPALTRVRIFKLKKFRCGIDWWHLALQVEIVDCG